MCLLVVQVARHKSKKGDIKKRVYFWGGISWYGKTPGEAWTAADNAVVFRHTKNLCVGTLFEDEDDATRYAMMLEDQEAATMDVVEVDDELAIKTCKHYNYKYAVITPNDIVIPPKNDNLQKD